MSGSLPSGPQPGACDPLETDRVVAQMAAAHVVQLDGSTVRLREFWKDTTAVTGFVRQFGCLFCHQMVHDLVVHTPEILRRGCRVVIVGNGSVEQAARFFSMKKLPRDGVSVVTDPDRESYKAAEFERGFARTFLHPGAHRAYGPARKNGHRITGLFGDLTQLGGLVATRPPATPLYFHRSRYAGDHADLDLVISRLPQASRSETSSAAG